MIKTALRIRSAALVVACALTTTPCNASAQEPARQDPLSAHNRHMYAGVKFIVLRSAEKMPEKNFAFKPTDAVRSYGQILGHVADSQYLYCSIVLGEKRPAPLNEKTKTSKADLIAGLKDAFAYCDRAYNAMTDSTATQMVNLGTPMPRLGLLHINNIHSTEHYGNLVTYLRMKNIVPPSSEPGFTVPAPKR